MLFLEFSEYAAPLTTFALGFALTYVLTPIIASKTARSGIVGIDVHKLDKRKVPEMGGLSIVIGLGASTIVSMIIFPEHFAKFIAFLLTVLIAGFVGVRDDIKPLNPKLKPLLTAAASIPILLLGVFYPRPSLPFIGRTRLTIVYPLLIPFAVAVPANAVNMMNPFNGVMTGTCSVISLVLAISMMIAGRTEDAILAAALLGCLLAFHRFNKYPARVFSGDTGDLSVGAALGALAIIGRVEVAAVVAMIPHIVNAFYLLSTLGGLYERRQISNRPTRVLPDGRIEATDDRHAPVTLTRMILAQGPLREPEIVSIMIVLTAIASAFAVFTQLLIPG